MWRFCRKTQFSHSFSDSSETVRKLCLSTNIPHQKIWWNYGIFCSASLSENNPQIRESHENIYPIRDGSRTVAVSKVERFVIKVNDLQPLTIITRHSILDVAAVLDPPLPITEKPENKVVTLDKIEQELNNVSFFRILFFFCFFLFFSQAVH